MVSYSHRISSVGSDNILALSRRPPSSVLRRAHAQSHAVYHRIGSFSCCDADTHTSTIMGRSKKQKNNLPLSRISGVLTSGNKSGIGRPRRASCKHVTLCAASQASACSLITGDRNLSLIPACFFLATDIPGHNPKEPRMNSQKGPAACRGWTAGSQPSPHLATDVACLRSPVIPWHMQQPLHKVWSHQQSLLTRIHGHLLLSLTPRPSFSFSSPISSYEALNASFHRPSYIWPDAARESHGS